MCSVTKYAKSVPSLKRGLMDNLNVKYQRTFSLET
jgi:hypothetical protein